MSLTPEQCRAARALLNWKQSDLAEASGVNRRTIARFELEQHKPHERNRATLRQVLETAGVVFIDSNGGGPGARLRERPASDSND